MRTNIETYANPNTGKCWTDAEERTFAEIMAVSRLNRMQSIQLWIRCRQNASKALSTAESNYPKPSYAVLNRLAKATAARLKRVSMSRIAPGKDFVQSKRLAT